MSERQEPSAPIPEATLRVLARSFFEQGRAYGFQFPDYVRFVNALLDVAIDSDRAAAAAEIPTAGMPLRGEQVVVRALAPADRDLLETWVADPEGRWFLLSRATGTCRGLAALLDDPANHFGVVEHEGCPVGVLAFLEQEGHKAELRKLIGDPGARGRGLARDATRLWVAYGQSALGLRKIYLYTLASNEGNVRLNQGLGFHVEGLLREEIRVDGQKHDVLRMALVT